MHSSRYTQKQAVSVKSVDSFLLSLPGRELEHRDIKTKKSPLTVEPFVITTGWVFRGFAPFCACWNLGSHWLWVQLWVLTNTANKKQGPQPGITQKKGLKHFCCTLLLALSAALALLQHSQKQSHTDKNHLLLLTLRGGNGRERGPRRKGDTGGPDKRGFDLPPHLLPKADTPP